MTRWPNFSESFSAIRRPAGGEPDDDRDDAARIVDGLGKRAGAPSAQAEYECGDSHGNLPVPNRLNGSHPPDTPVSLYYASHSALSSKGLDTRVSKGEWHILSLRVQALGSRALQCRGSSSRRP